ncbi:PTS sucrose transporter subunit IIBC [Virgibacillus sp. MSP4-1]|uniref:sucrose-specific PTS transporter subunit IIBC n=1 Tax=Virgibacillus sp. MSP4-1 TaxID=2700081 RepID=UPI00039EB140|nr:sucrose-specific PTS transporter subunit IIBC [Virgibacillus sp. MSP4-1]QHS21836.1 PTS sucrose transporter subunit IIBC [Virgibacillus sp. MSP4-1]
MSENKKIAEELIEAVGGTDNIQSVTHCATRLRFIIQDEDKVEKEKVEDIDKVKGAFFNSGQYQVIFGTGLVNRIYEEVAKFDLKTASKDEQKQEAAEQNGNRLQRAIRTFGDVFVPIIPVLVATGLFMGLRGLFVQEQILAFFGLTPEDIPANLLLYTEILTDTAFIFLPALVAWSTFKVFGGTPIIGIVLGLMLVSPSLPNAWGVAEGADPIMFFGFIPVVGYQGAVLPAFIAGIIGAKLEKSIRKRVPEALDLILTPFLTLLVMSILALFAIGPVFHTVENYILDIVLALLELPFGLAGLILGFFNQIIVITGVHHIFNLLEIQLLENLGENPFNAIVTSAIAAQGGAALAVGLKTKNKKLKALAMPSSVSAFLGITEPAIFGVNLRYGKPFLMGLIGGAAGGFVASITNLAGTGMSITVIPGTLLYLNEQIFLYLLVNIIGIAVAFGLTWMFGYSDEKQLKE